MQTRILIAEDDPYSLLILQLMLQKEESWEIVTAKDGNEAWQILQNSPAFDVCIFDIMMPGLDGLQLTARLRANARFEDQRIIFCTALNDRATIKQAAALSASHYITKPYQRDHVIRQVRRVCAQRAADHRVEPFESTAARLGIDAGQVLKMLTGLQVEVEGFIEGKLSTAPTVNSSETNLKINSLKGAAANLGATRLMSRLAALESSQPIDCVTAMEGVRSEARYLHRWLASTQPVAIPA